MSKSFSFPKLPKLPKFSLPSFRKPKIPGKLPGKLPDLPDAKVLKQLDGITGINVKSQQAQTINNTILNFGNSAGNLKQAGALSKSQNLLNFIKRNPKLAVAGVGAAGFAVYMLATGKGPEEALNDLTKEGGKLLKDGVGEALQIAGGVVAAGGSGLLEGIFGPNWKTYLYGTLAVIILIILGVIIYRLYAMNLKRQDASLKRQAIRAQAEYQVKRLTQS